MADNVNLAALAGNAATDERSIGGATVHVQRVAGVGGTAFASGQVTPTAVAATLVAARETRVGVTIFNGTNIDVFIATAAATSSFELIPGAGIRILTTALVQLIAASVAGLSGTVSYIEEYDA